MITEHTWRSIRDGRLCTYQFYQTECGKDIEEHEDAYDMVTLKHMTKEQKEQYINTHPKRPNSTGN
ncbi:MAG: hypothetical protein HMLIMOIP_002072 [Candidatus Nitrosomirales archaeon]|jgi:hypothetical protein